MEHVVFFPAPDGTPAFRRLPSLDDAVRFVEHLRNVENVSEASVHSLTEIPLQFKAWYRVELPADVASAGEVSGPAVAESDGATEVASAYSSVRASRGSVGDGGLFEGSVFEGVEFEGAGFDAAEFDGAQFDGAAFDGAQFDGAQVDGAQFDGAAFEPAAAPSPGSATGIVVAEPATMPAMQVLEPVAGTRRDRGIGFFAR